ncbi:hypothetical protein Tco_1008407 [Tanacetum coccineum]
MYTSKDDYLINTLRFVSRKESSQIYRFVLPECLISLEMKESKAYKTYLGHTTGVVPPKIARKFKKASPFKKDSIPVQADEEPVQKGKRVKRYAKKSSTTPAAGIVFRETPVKTKSTGKEKVDVSRRKGIDLLSEVALAEKAQLKEITPIVTNEGIGNKPGVPDVTEDDSTESESESWEQDEESKDDNQEEEETDQENESKYDEIKSDEDKGMDDTTNQFDDDVDARLEEPTQTGKEIVQGVGADKTGVPVTSSSCSSDLASKFLNFSDIPQTDAEIVSPLDAYVHHEVPRTQETTLLTIPVFVITESSPVYTNIPQSSQTFTFSPILTTLTPPPIIETTNPLSILPDASFFRFNNRITALEKEVVKIKKDPLYTQVTSLVDEHLDTRLGEKRRRIHELPFRVSYGKNQRASKRSAALDSTQGSV